AVERADADAIRPLEADVLAHAERDGGLLAEPGSFRLVALVGFDHLPDAPDRGVGGESEPLSKLLIGDPLEHELVADPPLEGDSREPVGRLVEALDRLAEPGGIFGRR